MSSIDEVKGVLSEIFPGAVIDQAISILNQTGREVYEESLVQLCLQIMEEDEFKPQADIGREREGMKMVLLIAGFLRMSPGKVASQCVHAALGCSRSATISDFEMWTRNGEKAVCLNVDTAEEMNTLLKRAKESGTLNVHECFDAGRTEVESGSRTVVAIGPHAESLIDRVTGHLALY